MHGQITIDDCEFGLDGSMWCCMMIGQTDLANDPAGFGETKEAAFQDLLDVWYK